tara:strand:- start:2403 stop:4001 length:1599 start_codon:yes stop_codon:yes gene_type:complete
MLNFGYQGIIGFFTICLISIVTSFFFPHNFFHNALLHLIGLSIFFWNFFKNKKDNIIQIKKLASLFLILLIGIYVFKNHDDFPYYHLTYALNLSQNSFMIGTGIFSHGFKTASSIFYYHSTLYLPFIKFYLFHSGPFLILIYFNYIILSKIFNKFKKKEFDIVYFFSLLNFIFVNVVFYRIAEHGTDRTAQTLLFLIFIILFELFYLKNNFKKKNILFNFLLVSAFLAASMKVLFYIYLIFAPIILFKDNFYKEYLVKKNLAIIFILIFSFSLNLTTNFFSTGCFVFPEEKTCIGKFDWSLPKKEVSRLKVHYEWWAKSGGGAGYQSKIEPEIYIKNFVWVKDWINRHFFNKVSDTLLGIIFISFLNLALFRGVKKKKIIPRNIILINSILLLLFLEWFLKHPSMRYGGFVLFALPIFILTSKKLESYKLNKKKALIPTVLLIFLTFFIYNARNVSRLNKEINNYSPGYNLLKSPFFHVDDVKVKISYQEKSFKIYAPIKNMCWAAPTPCSYNENLKVKNLYGFKIIQRADE